MAIHGFNRVLTAGRMKAAPADQEGPKRKLVCPNKGHQN